MAAKQAKVQDAATEIAQATNTKFSSDSADPVTAILAKYDKNGDGVFDIDECVAFPPGRNDAMNRLASPPSPSCVSRRPRAGSVASCTM
jgi:hypothetical protein